MTPIKPAVGLLYNPATPDLVTNAGELVEYLAVMHDRLWFDFGADETGRRFHRTLGAIEEFKKLSQGRTVSGHGVGMSLPSAIPLDEEFLAAVSEMAVNLGGFKWYSEHLSMFITPKGSVPNAQAGLGLPIAYDDEVFLIVKNKLRRIKKVLGCPIFMENGSLFYTGAGYRLDRAAIFQQAIQ